MTPITIVKFFVFQLEMLYIKNK